MWGLLLAPLLAPILWWLYTRPGKWAHDWLWRKLPEGRLRRLLLRKVSDKWIPLGQKDPNP